MPTTLQPATPNSYGIAPKAYRLPEGTTLGPVVLLVANLQRSLAFYVNLLGFRVMEAEAGWAKLAPMDDPRILIELREQPGARPAGRRGTLGLFHVAILLPSREALGAFIRHASAAGLRLGAGDHHVSEAVYCADPDGLGLEVYADRPREAWLRRGTELHLTTDPLNVDDLLRAGALSAWTGMPRGTTIGHVHLHVGDLQRSTAFYSEGLGLDQMAWSYPGAVFLGAGGYHHHLGTNVWAGPNAAPPAPHDAQMLEWSLLLPSQEDVARLANHLEATGHPASRPHPAECLTQDPWGMTVRVKVQASTDQKILEEGKK